MDDLLHLLHSDGADELRLHVGRPPVIVLQGEEQPIEGPAITIEDAERLFHSIANTRQRREFREHDTVEFIYRFRGRASFVVRAKMKGENVGMDIHRPATRALPSCERGRMTELTRQRLACSSYWLLFIILPSCAAVFFFNVSWFIGLPLFIGLILVGEHVSSLETALETGG